MFRLGMYGLGSWGTTKDSDVRRNHQKCDKWLEARPMRSYNYWKTLAHQVTFELENVENVINFTKEVLFYDDGIEGCAKASNQLLKQYIYDSSNGEKLLKVNSIAIDFVDLDVCRAVIDINFMYI